MSDVLTIHLGPMPWTNARSTWKHDAPEAYRALREACSGAGDKVVLRCPAVNNPNLEAHAEVDDEGFRATFTVTGAPNDSQRIARAEFSPSPLLQGYAVTSSFKDDGGQPQLTVSVECKHRDDQPDARLLHVLEVVMDLQYLSVKALIEVLNVEHAPPTFETPQLPLARQIMLQNQP